VIEVSQVDMELELDVHAVWCSLVKQKLTAAEVSLHFICTIWELKAMKVTCVSKIAAVVSATTGQFKSDERFSWITEMCHVSPLLYQSFISGTAEQHVYPLMVFCRS